MIPIQLHIAAHERRNGDQSEKEDKKSKTIKASKPHLFCSYPSLFL
jgi:hypothetical protein